MIFSLILLVTTLQRLANDEPTPEMKAQLEKVDDASKNVIDTCMTVTDKAVIDGCIKAINEMKDRCKDKTYSTMSVCADPRLDNFFTDIEERTKLNQQKKQVAGEKVNQKTLEIIDICMNVSNESDLITCKESMLTIKEHCLDPSYEQISACTDPRIEQILSRVH